MDIIPYVISNINKMQIKYTPNEFIFTNFDISFIINKGNSITLIIIPVYIIENSLNEAATLSGLTLAPNFLTNKATTGKKF